MGELGFFLKKVAAGILLPPFGPILWILIGAVWAAKARISGRIIFLGAVLIAFLLSLPVVADYMQLPFEVTYPPLAEIPTDTQAIVILGAGRDFGATEWGGETVSAATLERIRYGAWLAKLSHLPILVTGGMPDGGRHPEAYWMAQVLKQDYGIEVRWQEGQSRDTRENADFSRAVLAPLHVDHVVVVTDVVHMHRALADFVAAGFQPVAAPMGQYAHSPLTWFSFIPNGVAYLRAGSTVHELAGLVLERVEGIFPKG